MRVWPYMECACGSLHGWSASPITCVTEQMKSHCSSTNGRVTFLYMTGALGEGLSRVADTLYHTYKVARTRRDFIIRIRYNNSSSWKDKKHRETLLLYWRRKSLSAFTGLCVILTSPQTTDMNLGQAHRHPLHIPALDFWLETPKSTKVGKLLFRDSSESQNSILSFPTLLLPKMKQQGKQLH
jgi:hypothetical protein